MKDIRAQIIEILDEEIAKKKSRTTDDEIIVAADRIVTLGWYPKDFIMWILNDSPFWYEMIGHYWQNAETGEKYTLDELYNYWKTEVNK